MEEIQIESMSGTCSPIMHELNTEQKDQWIGESKPALTDSEFKSGLSAIRLSK